MLCSTALRKYRDGIVARHLRIRPKRLLPEVMPDRGLHAALRHVQRVRECPDVFRGFTLGEFRGRLRQKRPYALIDKGIGGPDMRISTCRIMKTRFAIQMFLRRTRRTRIIALIGCSCSATSAVSSTSSFGGLNPNRSFGFFFARVLRAARRPPDQAWGTEMAQKGFFRVLKSADTSQKPRTF
jgi:hypothetical protein